MREHPMEKAISEQLRGFIPIDDLDKKKIKKPYRRLVNAQKWQPRRRTEDIFIEMIDDLKTLTPKSEKPKRKRKRRRGPRVVCYHSSFK